MLGEADRPDWVCRHQVGPRLQGGDDAARHGESQHTSAAVREVRYIRPSWSWS